MSSGMPAALRSCAVRVPCSTSNLGAGFDCVGLALDRYLDVGYTPREGELDVRRAGTLLNLPGSGENDVLVATFAAELRRRGVEEAGGTLVMTSSIPIGHGLGSSAAAVVAGLALAAAACGRSLDREAALAAAVVVEGHPDNAAPSLFGGLVAAAYAHGVPRALRLPLADGVRFAFAAPHGTITTHRARAALPSHVPHSAAARNLGRMAALLYGLAQADGEAIAVGFTDELHMPYRLPLIPGAAATLDAAREAGAWGATISGSGSGVIAACPAGREQAVCDAMRDAFTRAEGAGPAFVARPDMHGAQPRALGTLLESLRT